MSLLISANYFPRSRRVGPYHVYADPFLENDRFVIFKKGVLLEPICWQIVGELESGALGPTLAKQDTEFSLVILDKRNYVISIITDLSGRELVYYSFADEVVVSLEFWPLLENISDKQKLKVSPEDVYLFLFTFSNPNHRTIVSNIKLSAPSSIITIRDQIEAITEYWTFRFSVSRKTRTEKFEELDKLIDLEIADFKELHGKDARYGVGISGGLDSRLIPFYCKKNELHVSAFIIGIPRPNGLFLSNDHRRALEISTYFGLGLQFLDNTNFEFSRLDEMDVQCNPSGSSEVFKIFSKNDVDFDFLITGASGYVVGSSPFYSKSKRSDIVETIIERQTILKKRRRFSRIKKGINSVIKTKIFKDDEVILDEVDGILPSVDCDILKESLRSFTERYRNKGLNDTEILMNYAIKVLGQRNKTGGFESGVGQFKSMTIYSNRMIKFFQNATEEELYDRYLFEEFIKEKHPGLALIESQENSVSLGGKNSFLNRIKRLISFAALGQGVMNYGYITASDSYRRYAFKVITRNAHISAYINAHVVLKNYASLDPYLITNIVKLCKILDRVHALKEAGSVSS